MEKMKSAQYAQVSYFVHFLLLQQYRAITIVVRERSGSGVLDSKPSSRRFELHRRHCVVSLSKTH